MAVTERLSLLFTADTVDARRSIGDLGRTVDRDLGGVERRSKSVAVAGLSMGTKLAAGAATAGYAMMALAEDGAALNQQVATSERVFGSAAAVIQSFGKQSAEALGQSEQAFLLNANRLGSMVTNLGFTKREAADASIQFSKMAADLGAAFGTDSTQAIEAIGAAFRGERDPIEQFGISIKQADVDARVAALGLDTSTVSAKKHSEAVATMALIQEQAGKTTGAFADSLENGAGRAKVAAAQVADAKASIGKSLAALTNEGAKFAAPILAEFTDIVTKMGEQRDAITTQVATNEKWGRSYEEAGEYLKRVREQITGLQADAAEASSELVDFGDIGDQESKQMLGLANSLQWTAAIMDGQREAARQLAEQHDITYDAAWKLVTGQKEAADASKDAGDAAEDQAEKVRTLGERYDDARKAVEDWRDGLLGNANAEADYYEAGSDLLKQLAEKGTGFNWLTGQVNLNSEAGRENLRVSDEFARDAIAFAQAEAQRTGSLEAGRAKLQEVRDWFIRTQMGAGMSEAAAKAYADRLGLVPKTIETTWVANGLADAEVRAQRLLEMMQRFQSSSWGGGGFLTGGYVAPSSPSPAAAAAAAGAAAGFGAATRSVDGGAGQPYVIHIDGEQVAKGLARREGAYR